MHFTNSSVLIFLNVNVKGYELTLLKKKKKKLVFSRPVSALTSFAANPEQPAVQGGQGFDPCGLQHWGCSRARSTGTLALG